MIFTFEMLRNWCIEILNNEKYFSVNLLPGKGFLSKARMVKDVTIVLNLFSKEGLLFSEFVTLGH